MPGPSVWPMSSSEFFSWLQGADFYVRVHAEAVSLAAERPGRWLDVGCGPGLVTRLAASRGHVAVGADASPAMIRTARRLALAERSAATFEVATIEELAARPSRAEVVSAASLLAVIPNEARGLDLLWRSVAPGGALLIVETTPAMRPAAALRLASGRRASGLLLWAVARRGRSCAPVMDTWRPVDLAARAFHPLLGGLVGAWLFRRTATTQGASR